ncbi:hypothetical protein AGDE_12035 [Angomonas deanei]|uniref:CCCH-type zinc finger containing protein, putative n=1 Tax=Angomonas deanei TaxID=59799 RepID=A0A7G2C6H0_9TRYP|nr:hypothetical protein AGDE_12035 [Angomonas deanei]CAD2215360.1 CCCH-type zinc finger containing protein, putative [Angomonas deanei]|eukprot:EPY25070.1 hypothetical protein AGDE_12035 [Angomonas deanei]
MWNIPGGNGANGNRNMAGPNGYAYLASNPMVPIQNGSNGGPPGTTEVCKYFVNGGCTRGMACPYLHELPDERHLDVNGLGFILNPNVQNVQNAQKPVSAPNQQLSAAAGSMSPSGSALGINSQNRTPLSFNNNATNNNYNKPGGKVFIMGANNQVSSSLKQPPLLYRPPEPFLDHNLPPTLALSLGAPGEDFSQGLARALLQN